MAQNTWEEYMNNARNNVDWSSMYMGYKCFYDAVEAFPWKKVAKAKISMEVSSPGVTGYSSAFFESFDTYEEAKEMREKHLADNGDAEPISS
ncbi:hypothetical protein RIF29_26302 [Crotalaria pallida]|uniref:Uncharacterized protein n=1 Tax=Crotalaria pallida TaxID=3830 RepID=A0AAN9I4R8_CROPI